MLWSCLFVNPHLSMKTKNILLNAGQGDHSKKIELTALTSGFMFVEAASDLARVKIRIFHDFSQVFELESMH